MDEGTHLRHRTTRPVPEMQAGGSASSSLVLELVDALLASDKGAFRSALSHLVLPAIALGTIPLAVIARMTRSSMLEVLREDYVRTARAKGASTFRVIAIHALRREPND